MNTWSYVISVALPPSSVTSWRSTTEPATENSTVTVPACPPVFVTVARSSAEPPWVTDSLLTAALLTSKDAGSMTDTRAPNWLSTAMARVPAPLNDWTNVTVVSSPPSSVTDCVSIVVPSSCNRTSAVPVWSPSFRTVAVTAIGSPVTTSVRFRSTLVVSNVAASETRTVPTRSPSRSIGYVPTAVNDFVNETVVDSPGPNSSSLEPAGSSATVSGTS